MFTAEYLAYKDINSFSDIAKDYLSAEKSLQEFYMHLPTLQGIKDAIAAKQSAETNRKALVSSLQASYKAVKTSEKVTNNIAALLEENTFTICTAHQPNIFTGHLYFIYKIMHAIKLADQLRLELPACNFVPVYYMGSEDADLEELGTVHIGAKTYVWDTEQQGAVGRMTVDKKLLKIIDGIEAQIGHEAFGAEILELVKQAYSSGATIQEATFIFVNKLFADYGLVVLLSEGAELKKQFLPIAEKEIREKFSAKAVEETVSRLPKKYKIQAAGRDINLFYLEGDNRERIVQEGNEYKIEGKSESYSDEAFLKLLSKHPETISPNVILRPVYQELILPNIAFIGGGGELAYWLELKKVFEEAKVDFPVLLLRNSFAFVDENSKTIWDKLQLKTKNLFDKELQLLTEVASRKETKQLSLANEKLSLIKVYKDARTHAAAIDPTLERHVWSLQQKALEKINALEKKMMSATRRKAAAEQGQIKKVKAKLYPSGTLQERRDNLLPYYAKYGANLIKEIYDYSLGLEMQFCVLTEQPNHA